MSRVLKLLTGAEYNHVSISLTPTLEEMYSFGRLNPYNPFLGGFVEEGKNKGTFKRFYNTHALILELRVSKSKYNSIKYFISYFSHHRLQFKYNYWGLVFACFKKNYEPRNKYYCSQFVRTCLSSFGVENAEDLPKIIKPIDFLKLDNKKIIYQGLLSKYDP